MFCAVLALCEKAGLVKSGIVAIDGTKLYANASRDSNFDYDRVAREILAEAIATDQAEDEQHGESRGEELPPELATEEGRREWLARHLEAERKARREQDPVASEEPGAEPDQESGATLVVEHLRGRRVWLREAPRQPEQDRWQEAGPVPRSRPERLVDAGNRLEQDLAAEHRGASREAFGAKPRPRRPGSWRSSSERGTRRR